MHRMMLVAALAVGLGADLRVLSAEDGGVRQDKDKQQTEKEKAGKEKKPSRPVKKKPKEGKVFTNTDLGTGASRPAPSPASGAAPSSSASPSPEPVSAPPEEERAEAQRAGSESPLMLPDAGDEAGWRFQAEGRRTALRAAERTVADVEARLAALMTDLAPTNVTDPFRLQTIEAQKAKARQDLEAAKAELARLRAAWSEFEEAARRKGVPPRWLEPPSS